MLISIIVAVAENGVIGKAGKVPWHLRTDLKRFKTLTMGHHLLMGRKTYESIGSPLPGRINIVISRTRQTSQENLIWVQSINEGLLIAWQSGEEELFVIGGSQIYAATLPITQKIYMTRVHAKPDGDTFFPEFDETMWTITEQQYFPADEENDYPSTYKILLKNSTFP